MLDHVYELISYGDLPSGRATEVRRVSNDYMPKFILPLSAIAIEERMMVKAGGATGQMIIRARIPDHIARSRGLDPVIDAPRNTWELWDAREATATIRALLGAAQVGADTVSDASPEISPSQPDFSI